MISLNFICLLILQEKQLFWTPSQYTFLLHCVIYGNTVKDLDYMHGTIFVTIGKHQ